MKRAYAGLPAAERQAARRTALLDAGLDLLEEGGAEAVTMRALCTRARLNDRYFYEHFTDRDAFLVAMLDLVVQHGTTRILEAVAAEPGELDDRVRAAMAAGLAYLGEDPRRGRMLVESQATAALRRRRHQVTVELADQMVLLGYSLLGEGVPPGPDARLVALILVNGFLELLASWLQGELDVDEREVQELLVGMVLGNLDVVSAVQNGRG